ncbi:MAG TPA: FAD-dependent oxidoreductase [Vicinamibacterales bacterium]|jgi:glycine/D-amino acid oxidase-like deaminating enzyme|nr:FAD-dependent oxidoreductase [Vicinamibacterales bacterium]
MRTRYGISPWIDTFPRSRRPDHPRFRGEFATDIVIVGGGLTGCATAYACAVAGLKPVLVEADRLGQGSSGRSAGLLLPEPGPSFRDVAARYGLRAARRIFESWRRASLDAAALIRRLKIQCGLEACEHIVVASRDDAKGLRREFEARSAAGLDCNWLSPANVRKSTALEAAGAMRLDASFTLDPYRACLGLAAAAKSRGGIFFEKSRVTKVRAGAKNVEITLEGGVIRARAVIVCTGMATAEFKPLRRHFKPREQYFVVTEPVGAAIRKQLASRDLTIADSASPPHQVRWTRDDRLLVTGATQDVTPTRKRDAVLVQRTGQLMYELLMMNPAISGLQPEYGWDASYGETADGIMYIGPHRNYPRHLFGLGGQSLSGAFLAARVLARAANGESDKHDDVFGWTR